MEVSKKPSSSNKYNDTETLSDMWKNLNGTGNSVFTNMQADTDPKPTQEQSSGRKPAQESNK